MLCCGDQISVVTAYGFVATIVILVLPLVTEIHELRKFWLERSSIEPGSPDDIQPRRTPPVADNSAPAAAAEGDDPPLKPMRRTLNGAQRSASEITVDDGVGSQTDTV